ncbi:MAG: hypothetical protein WBH77_06860 [Saccharofermentanales bacterium]
MKYIRLWEKDFNLLKELTPQELGEVMFIIIDYFNDLKHSEVKPKILKTEIQNVFCDNQVQKIITGMLVQRIIEDIENYDYRTKTIREKSIKKRSANSTTDEPNA